MNINVKVHPMNINVKVHPFLTIKDLAGSPTINNELCYRKGNGFGGAYIWGFAANNLGQLNIHDEKVDLEKKDHTKSDLDTLPGNCDHFIPYYIGKHYSDVYSRVHEGLCYLRGGNFPIFDLKICKNNNIKIGHIHRQHKSASNGLKPNSGPAIVQPNPGGLLYYPEGINKYYDFYTDNAVQKQIDWMVNNFCVLFIEPVYPHKMPYIINALEKALGNLDFKGKDILYDHTVTKRLSPAEPKDQICCNGKPINSFCDLWESLEG